MVLAIAWPGQGGVEPWSRVFWIHQALSAAGSLAFILWVVRLASRNPDHSRAEVIPFPRRR